MATRSRRPRSCAPCRSRSTGLAVALAFRAGLLNIGAEGQLLAGAAASTAGIALFAAIASVSMPCHLCWDWACWPVRLWAGIASLLRQRYGVLEVISTIMLNFVALYAVGWLVRGPLQEPSRIYPQSIAIDRALQLPVLIPGTRLHVGVLLAVLLAAAAWWWLRNTASGFRLRAVGLNASAAATSGGIDVGRVSVFAFLISGALAGLAGSVEYTGVTYALYENLSPGYGYTAIAVALLARLNPLGVLGTAVMFGALQAGGNAMQRDAGVPIALVNVVEAVIILLVIAGDRVRSWSPRSAVASFFARSRRHDPARTISWPRRCAPRRRSRWRRSASASRSAVV